MRTGTRGIVCQVRNCLAKVAYESYIVENDKGAAKKLDMQKPKPGFSCPVIERAFNSKAGYCSKDCDKLLPVR